MTVWDVGQNPSTRRHFEPRIVQPVGVFFFFVFFLSFILRSSLLFFLTSFPITDRLLPRIPQTTLVTSSFRLGQRHCRQHTEKERRPCRTLKAARERRRRRRRRRRASPRQRSLRDKPIKGHTSKMKRSKGKKGGRRGRSFLVEEQARNQ